MFLKQNKKKTKTGLLQNGGGCDLKKKKKTSLVTQDNDAKNI